VPPLPGRPDVPTRLEAPVRETVEAEVALPRIYLAFRIPPYGDPGFFPADVAATVLATGKSSRLYRALVREQRLAQSVVAFAFPIVTGASMLVIWATANPGVDPAKVEEALWAEIEALAAEPEPREIERAVTGIESRQLIALQQVGERADQISMFATLFDDPGGSTPSWTTIAPSDPTTYDASLSSTCDATRPSRSAISPVPGGRPHERAIDQQDAATAGIDRSTAPPPGPLRPFNFPDIERGSSRTESRCCSPVLPGSRW
jgi:hypothetical protein